MLINYKLKQTNLKTQLKSKQIKPKYLLNLESAITQFEILKLKC
jgi:hypothetical protein